MPGSVTPKEILPPLKGEEFVESAGELLNDADIVFGNLEGAFINDEMQPQKCSDRSRKAATCYEFGIPEYLAHPLKELGFNVLNQDNNHSEDYGYEGYKFTQDKLSALGIKFMPKQGFAEFTIGTKHIAIAAFGYSSNSNNISDLEDAKKIISGLDEKYDLIIVSFHGGAEGKNAQHVFDSTETFLGENRGNVFAFAHTVIDAGADLVIGHGPHVLRAVEIYKQKLIAYSLGNFLTYGNINTGGISGIAVILDVEIDSTNGNFVRGKLLPVKQVGYGIPEYDLNNEGINLIRSLTENDFPGTKLLITPDGKIYYTGFGKISFRFFDDGKEDVDRKSTRLNSSHIPLSRMPSSA